MKIIGEWETRFYKITIMTDSSPKTIKEWEAEWLYITKRGRDGAIGRQSIGMGMSDIDTLIRLLSKASGQYQGKRKEFRVQSGEFE